jgi:hypothetical protein
LLVATSTSTKFSTILTFFDTLSSCYQMSSTKGVSTRAKNAVVHPGLVVKGKTRRSSKEVAAERQAKEEAKQEKARTKAAGIKRVAEYEMAQADKDAADATPRAAPKTKPLMRTRSYADVVAGSDAEMTDGEVLDSNFDPENEDIPMTASDAETEIVELPPKKKKKMVEKVVENEATAKKVKAPKPKVRDAIKAVKLEEEKGPARPKLNDDILEN